MPSSGCQFGIPNRFPYVWGMVFALNLRMLRGIGLSTICLDLLYTFVWCNYCWLPQVYKLKFHVKVCLLSTFNSITSQYVATNIEMMSQKIAHTLTLFFPVIWMYMYTYITKMLETWKLHIRNFLRRCLHLWK